MKLRIIAADPQPDMQRFYQIMIPRMGHELTAIVASGKELIERCLELGPDLILADYRLSDMSGGEAVERLSDHAVCLPAIILTGVDEPTHCLSDDVTFVTKPIGHAALENLISDVVLRFRNDSSLAFSAVEA